MQNSNPTRLSSARRFRARMVRVILRNHGFPVMSQGLAIVSAVECVWRNGRVTLERKAFQPDRDGMFCAGELATWLGY